MSLDWSVKNVENYEQVLEPREEANITEALVWRTMVIGINRITEDNWKEVYIRCRAADQVHGPALFKFVDGRKVSALTPESVKRRIGLYTNASNLKQKEFFSRLGTAAYNYADQAAEYVFDKMEDV